MANIIVILIILAVLTGASYKIYKEKKAGAKCVGCPYSKSDGGGCSCD